jgi:pre-mRNA-splicing factor ATP-dependent RNA helicase DHX38/PRP16
VAPDFETDEDRAEWEEEQKRLDREWYSMDEGYDDTHNPFSNTSQAYADKKEKELEDKKKKRMTARQQQIHKVRYHTSQHFCDIMFCISGQ